MPARVATVTNALHLMRRRLGLVADFSWKLKLHAKVLFCVLCPVLLVIPTTGAAARSTPRMLINYFICFINHKIGMPHDPPPLYPSIRLRWQRLSAHLVRPTLRMINVKSNGRAGKTRRSLDHRASLFRFSHFGSIFFFVVFVVVFDMRLGVDLPCPSFAVFQRQTATGMGIKMNEIGGNGGEALKSHGGNIKMPVKLSLAEKMRR